MTMEEFQNFIGIILLSGFNSRSNSHMYCETDPLVNCPAVSMTMSRNRFMEIKSALHAANNDILLKTRMAKVSPLYNILNEGLLQYGVFHEELSVDECMIPYYGHHSCKQYIRGKPIRFGYKCWMQRLPLQSYDLRRSWKWWEGLTSTWNICGSWWCFDLYQSRKPPCFLRQLLHFFHSSSAFWTWVSCNPFFHVALRSNL